ncbi:MAG: hypothetical protein GYB21_05285, partial [Oceanospirillales bacterium]|nr:hypothetical protein [Oceanospirillales bacterium]
MAKRTEPTRARVEANDSWQAFLLPTALMILLLAVLIGREANAATAVE